MMPEDMRPVPPLDGDEALDQRAQARMRDLEMEQTLLANLMTNGLFMEKVSGFLRPHHFVDEIHARIYAAMDLMQDQGEHPTLVGVSRALTGASPEEKLYIRRVAISAGALANTTHYARGIVDAWTRRQIIAEAEGVIGRAMSDYIADAETILHGLERSLEDIPRNGAAAAIQHHGDAADAVMIDIDQAMKGEATRNILMTGFYDLDKHIGGMARSDLLILAGRPSMGKAQSLDAKVLMRDGAWKRMGDIVLGDKLASVDGAPSVVTGIFPRGQRGLLRVTMSDGRSTKACGEHLWEIRSSKVSGGKAVVDTNRLREMMSTVRYRRRVSLPLATGHFGHDRDLPIDAWFLGALIGNGCMTTGHLSISTQDAQTLYRAQQCVGHDNLISASANGYDYRIKGSSRVEVRSALQVLGLADKGSPEKFIPEIYMSASRAARLELLRGLLDTDGWVETFGAVRFCTTSPRLSTDVQALVWSLGGVCTIGEKYPIFSSRGEKKHGLKAYVLNISHPDRASLVSLIRKRRRCLKDARFRAPTIVSVEADGAEETRCITVSHSSRLYVTDDYIVTHNSALAGDIAMRFAGRPKDPVAVGIFSLEMSKKQWTAREISMLTGISTDDQRLGNVDMASFQRIAAATQRIKQIPILIDDRADLTIGQLRDSARTMVKKNGVGLIIVDYLQLLVTDQRSRDGNRTQEITEISRALKQMAKALDVPVIALSQLNRGVEQREDKRPMLSDLRESGSIEQDADAVVMIYRPEYYIEREQPQKTSKMTPEQFSQKEQAWYHDLEEARGKTDLLIVKSRHGKIGKATLLFNGAEQRFENAALGWGGR